MTRILRRTYQVQSWNSWDHETNGFITDFRERFHIAPHIMLASEVTYSRIDLAANRTDNITNNQGEQPSEGEFASLTSFISGDCTLRLCIDDRFRDRVVVLIHDSDPNGGGEVPEEDTECDVVDPRFVASG